MSETFHLALSNGSEAGAVDPEWTWGVMEPGRFCFTGYVDVDAPEEWSVRDAVAALQEAGFLPAGEIEAVKEMDRPDFVQFWAECMYHVRITPAR